MANKYDQGAYRDVCGMDKDTFASLEKEQKDIILVANNEIRSQAQNAGWIGGIIGTNPRNASIHIALIVSVLSFFVCIVDLIRAIYEKDTISEKIWNALIPVVTASLGYIFGKGQQ